MDNLEKLLNHFHFNTDEGGGGGTPQPKTYNQDEVNGIVGDRLAKERAKIYKALGIEDESGIKDISSKLTLLTTENATLKGQVEAYTKEKTQAELKSKLIGAGIDEDFIDVAIAKWDGKQDLAEFTKANPKLTKEFFMNAEQFKGTGGSLEGKGAVTIDESKLSTEEFMKLKKEGKI